MKPSLVLVQCSLEWRLIFARILYNDERWRRNGQNKSRISHMFSNQP